MILPQMEGANVYNALNVLARLDTGLANAQSATAYYASLSTWLCPSDGKNGGGFVPSSTQDGNWSAWGDPPNPATGLTMCAVSNYAGSFGDNYCIGATEPTGWTVGNPVRDGPASGNSADRLGRVLGHNRTALVGERLPTTGHHGTTPRFLRLRHGPGCPHRLGHGRDQQHAHRRRSLAVAGLPTATSGHSTAARPGRPCRSTGRRPRRFARTPPGPLSARPTGSADLATRPRGSRAHTPVAPTSVSRTGRCGSSRRPSAWQPTARWGAGPAVRSSVPTPIERKSLRIVSSPTLRVTVAGSYSRS